MRQGHGCKDPSGISQNYSGTRQIRTAIDRSGVSKGDTKAWLVRLPEIDTSGGIGETSSHR